MIYLICFPSTFVVLGGDLRRARNRPNWHLPWRLRPPVGEDQRLLQRGHRYVSVSRHLESLSKSVFRRQTGGGTGGVWPVRASGLYRPWE